MGVLEAVSLGILFANTALATSVAFAAESEAEYQQTVPRTWGGTIKIEF